MRRRLTRLTAVTTLLAALAAAPAAAGTGFAAFLWRWLAPQASRATAGNDGLTASTPVPHTGWRRAQRPSAPVRR